MTLHHIPSHHIKLYHIVSHYITSHHFTSHHITSHHITSHHITSHHITSHHKVSYHNSKVYDLRGFVWIVRHHCFVFMFVKLHLRLAAFCTINTSEKRQIIEAQLSWLKHTTFVRAKYSVKKAGVNTQSHTTSNYITLHNITFVDIQLLSPIKITGKKTINIILAFFIIMDL